MNQLNILVLVEKPFPLGLAGTNRLISFCKGLVELGDNVDVIITKPTEKKNNIKNSRVKGKYYGINYNYAHKSTIWPDDMLNKIYVAFISLFQTFRLYQKRNSELKYDAIICYHNSFILNFSFFILTLFRKTKIIYKATEFPLYMWFDKKPTLFKKLLFNIMVKLFDGVIVMTHPLFDFYKKRVSKKCHIFLMPMTVELERFKNATRNIKENNEYIAYIGTLDLNKDGVYDLIKAFSLISDNYPLLSLKIIGGAVNKNEFIQLNKLVNSLGLTKKIKFTGIIDRDEVPYYLCNAKILALARPESTRSLGGFPTKLGEYLATGKPVLVTSVGDIPKYLIDEINSFLVPPNSPELFAEKMNSILLNYDFASKVGLKGKELANNIFNYKIQSRKLHEYLVSLTK